VVRIENAGRLRRRNRMILLALSLLSMAAALVMIYLAFLVLDPMSLREETRRHIMALALVAGGLIIFALFCVGVLLLRLVAQHLLRRRTADRTVYVNAWEEAGRRRAVPDEEELDELVIADQRDWGDDDSDDTVIEGFDPDDDDE